VIECVPNISEGIREDAVSRIADAVETTGCTVLDVHRDPDHHRSVFTFVGEHNQIEAGAIELVRSSIALLDLRSHVGAHPRIGAVDVIPFVPLDDTTMEACVELAQCVGSTVARRFKLPVFLYAEAARHAQRRRLAAIRRGQFEGLAVRLQSEAWCPDFGPTQPHPTAGAVAIGARDFLVAFNVVLKTDNVGIAQAIARNVRASSGGLPGIQALGLLLSSRNLAQVSMNLVDVSRTGLQAAFDAVRAEAAAMNVGVLESEIVGLVPGAAVGASTTSSLALKGELADKLLEQRLAEAFG